MQKARGHIEARAIGQPGRGKYVPSMHRKRSSIGRRSGVDGGVLAVCIGKFRKFFKANGLGLIQKTKEK